MEQIKCRGLFDVRKGIAAWLFDRLCAAPARWRRPGSSKGGRGRGSGKRRMDDRVLLSEREEGRES